MTTGPDWELLSPAVFDDQIAAYDGLRHRCPVAWSDHLHWSLFRHADVLRVLNDPATFSNAVSARRSVPNGIDPPEHTAYRRLIEPYFGPQRIRTFEPVCRSIATDLVARLPERGEVELMDAFASEFALRVQCAFLGWPNDLHEPLRRWIHGHHAATLARDRTALAAVALEFDGHVRAQLEARRHAPAPPEDVTTSLMRDRIDGRPLNDEELISILRNWTVGELGTIAAGVGIIAHYLAQRPDLQQRLRGGPALLPAAIDEILRIHPPLIANRRVATRAVDIGGRRIEAGGRITLMWASANRDESVFGDPDDFRLDRDPAQNLLYGWGIHVCPGAPLARLELLVVAEVLLAQRALAPAPGKAPVKAVYPAGGFATLPLAVATRGA